MLIMILLAWQSCPLATGWPTGLPGLVSGSQVTMVIWVREG
jgi:hypothetical protein